MKWMIASDIHGSAHFCRLLLENFERERADRLLLLGDLLYHGPRNDLPRGYDTRETARRLNEYCDKISAVRGNCDSEVDQMISTFQFVREDIVALGNRRIMFTHGHVHNKDSLPYLAKGDVVMYGHFHVNELNVVDGITCIALSSCSLPKCGAAPAYALCNEKSITVYDFDDNVLFESVASAE